ncbi:sugar-binding transcriptional regulator [uncultured Tateyamaria sp.]|uniref:sugar-binding transcriptional regulator n=1 Tax=uncultured Tateyamaria sp. TaxID=455651 RepID=UPI00261AA14A|nr:sugar-binding domain-containing protein [uncultured Tateyamaria sp.]
MNKTGGTFSKDHDRTARLSNVALLYYGEGLTQSEIAKRLQVSRVTVVNLLREARDQGIVEIHVNGEQLKESTLARELASKFDLEDVYVSDVFDTQAVDRAAVLRQLGRVASMAFLDIVEPGDRIGIAWGETIMAMSDALPRVRVEGAEVSQLIGSMISKRVPASENCTIRIASQIGAVCYTLHAPALASTPELAQLFRDEPTIATQLERLQNLDMVAYSIGNLSDETHMAAAGMTTVKELHAAQAKGARGIICCRFIDADGRGISLPPTDRIIASELADLRAAKKRMLVVCGEDRLDAIQAAIMGGLATHLCIDAALGKALLSA